MALSEIEQENRISLQADKLIILQQKGIDDLKQRLTHYYEIDLGNCEMSHEQWIEELAKSMFYVNYKNNFIKEHEAYKKMCNA